MTRTNFLLLSLGVLLRAPAISAADRQPHTFFKNVIKLSDDKVQQIEHGEVVTKVLKSSSKHGLLVFGAVYVNASLEKFADVARDVAKLEQEEVYNKAQEFGESGATLKLSDFDRLELDKKSIDKLKNCRPGNCDLQLINFQVWQQDVDWNAPDKYAAANKVVRQRVYEGLNTYMEGGLKALGSYQDRTKPLNLYEAMKEMVDSSYYLPRDRFPEIHDHVVDYPEKKMEGVEDIFYWVDIDFGQGPVLWVNHLTIFPKVPQATEMAVATKQIYSSKYTRTALQMYYCLQDTANPDKPGFYLVTMSDSRMPDFGGIKLRVVRRIATKTAVRGTQDTLEIYKRRTENTR